MPDIFEDLFDLGGKPRRPGPAPAVEKGVRIKGHDQDGTYYVRLDQVVELLEINAVLPKATARFKAFLKGRA